VQTAAGINTQRVNWGELWVNCGFLRKLPVNRSAVDTSTPSKSSGLTPVLEEDKVRGEMLVEPRHATTSHGITATTCRRLRG
jgi:hypothetical protein